MEAKWNGKTIARSTETIVVEGNHYFPPESVNQEYLQKSNHSSVCPWKGTAAYYDVLVEGKVNKNAAWYYPQPSDKASHIKNYLAFWQGVEVI